MLSSILKKIKAILKNPKYAFAYIRGIIGYKLGLSIPASQFGEDLILNYLIRKENGFYVDIGSNDPYFGNNTYLFHSKGRKGITIEPNKKLHNNIKWARSKAINLNLAVGLNDGSLKYYELDAHGMSTCDKDIADFYVSKGHKIVNTYSTNIKTLKEILDTHLKGNHIDIMSIDVEGMDMDVLKSNDWHKYRPDFIILETMKYKSDNEPGERDEEIYGEYLKEYGYIVIANTYVNTIYKKI